MRAEADLYAEALSHLASSLTPQNFLPLLPPSASLNFHLPFIKLCMQKHGLLNLSFQNDTHTSLQLKPHSRHINALTQTKN